MTTTPRHFLRDDDDNGEDASGRDDPPFAAGRRVVDDHPVVRLGIRQTIDAQPDMEVCCEAELPVRLPRSVSVLCSGSMVYVTTSARASLVRAPTLLVSSKDDPLVEPAPERLLAVAELDRFTGKYVRSPSRLDSGRQILAP